MIPSSNYNLRKAPTKRKNADYTDFFVTPAKRPTRTKAASTSEMAGKAPAQPKMSDLMTCLNSIQGQLKDHQLQLNELSSRPSAATITVDDSDSYQKV